MTSSKIPHGWTPALYLLLTALIAWPLAASPMDSMLGFPNVDGMDTAMLRAAFARALENPTLMPWSDWVYFPTGFPVLHLMPNWLDHLSAYPLVRGLPFPLADNVWWWLVMAANGWAAHRLGLRVGGSHGAGLLAGVGFVVAEPVLREANLHHAPQSMLFWGPLYIHALLDALQRPDQHPRAALLAGLYLGAAGLTYWYMALFLVLGTAPLLWELGRKPAMKLASVTCVTTAPVLAPLLIGWNALPITANGPGPIIDDLPDSFGAIPESHHFSTLHGSDWGQWQSAPMDIASGASILLLLAAIWASRRSGAPDGLPSRSQQIRIERGLWWMAGLGLVMALGPYLKWSGELVLIDGNALPLPFRWLASIHPIFDRLTWPERWSVITPLALITLAAKAPRPGWFAAGILLEALVFSSNLPLQHASVASQRCWTQLDHTQGAILELPLKRGGLQAPFVGIHQRFHGRPVVNPVLLPPGVEPPEEWQEWQETIDLVRFVRAIEANQSLDVEADVSVDTLVQEGVTAIAIDAEPFRSLTPGGVNRYRVALNPIFGQPIDLGCAMVWWLDPEQPAPEPMENASQWRDHLEKELAETPAPALNTLIRPMWNRLRPKTD